MFQLPGDVGRGVTVPVPHPVQNREFVAISSNLFKIAQFKDILTLGILIMIKYTICLCTYAFMTWALPISTTPSVWTFQIDADRTSWADRFLREFNGGFFSATRLKRKILVSC